MLWTLIFEFFVRDIFGGILFENGSYISYQGVIGMVFMNGAQNNKSTAELTGVTLSTYDGSLLTIPFGNYLSLIATIITMIILLIVIGHFIKKLFNLFGRII